MPCDYFGFDYGYGHEAQQAYQWLAAQQQAQAAIGLDQLVQKLAPVPPREPADEEGDMINNFRVGCDPEFMLLDANGRTVAANLYFPHDGPVGYDHNGRVAELRPAPTFGVYPIVKKMHELINGPLITSTGAKLRAGAICNKDCLGGHVHFGFNCFEQKPPNGCSSLLGGRFNAKGAKVVTALDSLTKVLEHLDILPKTESTQRRMSAQGAGSYYGAYSDVRDCQGHMEYRTMASWLYDPRVSFLCLTAAKIAASDPEGAHATLKNCTSWAKLGEWLQHYENKDANAKRVCEKIIDKGLKTLQVDPTTDFRSRWENLGI